MVRSSIKVQSIEHSVATEITKRSKLVSPGKKIDRLIFENAAHRSDFNVAVAKRKKDIPLLGGRRWIPIKVKEEGKKSKIVYVNVNSLSKRLDLKKSEIYRAHKNLTLETLIKDKVATKISEIAEPDVAPAFQTPSVKLHSYMDRMKAGLADSWWQFTTGSWNLFSFRFMLGASDEKLQKEGKLRAMTSAREAYKTVPAYKAHVKTNPPQDEKDKQKKFKHFEDLPLTGKKEYIQKVADVDDLYVNGEIPKRGQIDSSTGTTGEPAVWIRSQEELEMTQKLMSFAKRAMFNTEDIAVINTFALGLWATGITIAGSGPGQGLIANVGVVPDYAEKSVSLIKKLTNKDPQKSIVLCGYPPNIRKIAQAIKNDPDLKDKDLNLHAIVGGEAMTEEMRDDILSNGFKNVASSYGASDLDINIGYETATEVAIRRACIENPELAKELYGGGPPPMVFHYDPLHYYIETVNDELVFTCCRKERASPRIRYNLHDTGKVMMAKDVVAILKKYGVEITLEPTCPSCLFTAEKEL